MSGFTLCADFNIFPDNHRLGPNFTLAGFDFVQAGGMLMFVNETESERGLQFPNEGIEIMLPFTTDSITLRLGTFNGEVEIEARSLAGNVVQQRTVPGLNQYINVRLLAPNIATVALKGGGDEGIILTVCVTVCFS